MVLPRPADDDQRLLRDRMAADQQAAYTTRSPALSPFQYSPKPFSISSNPPPSAPSTLQPVFGGQSNRSQPASPSSGPLPSIASGLFQRESTGSKYYDPTSDHRDRGIGRNNGQYHAHLAPQTREQYNHLDNRPVERNMYDRSYRSPVSAHFPPQSPPTITSHSRSQHGADRPSQSPRSPTAVSNFGKSLAQSPAVGHTRTSSQGTPQRTADPMSLSSIMSAPTQEPPVKVNRTQHPPPEPIKSAKVVNGGPSQPKVEPLVTPIKRKASPSRAILRVESPPKKIKANGVSNSLQPTLSVPPEDRVRVSSKDVDAEVAKIEAMELSDVEGPGFAEAKAEWAERSKRRMVEIDSRERQKRKRRRIAQLSRLHDIFETHVEIAKEQYMKVNEKDAWQEVQNQEIADEKERKKDMQRKRRREKTLQNECQKRDEAIEKAQRAADEEEKVRFIKEAQRAEKKAKATNQLLHGTTPSKEFREVTPHGPNLEGGTMSSFQMSDEVPRESKKKGGGKAGNRPKKSKEQKQAEKNAAAAAQAALERGDELPVIAPKEEARLEALKKETKEASRRKESTPPEVIPYISKAYNQLYEQIWRDIAKKDIPKVWRLKETSLATKQSNLRKTGQLASKEARRWQLKTNKSTKDVQARSKRSMREMLSFWKRNEREERDQRKLAEKQELENAKKAEADREANRQKRKLNFLISQTELYSHFIGKKVKTDEVERSTDDVAVSDRKVTSGPSQAHTIDLPDTLGQPAPKVTNFEDLDFDAEDDTALRAAAMANAQNAVQEAQDRARAFNNDGQLQDQLDEGEMNFQNPTSLQNMDVAQPQMLTCQLKEYQLKGLNWLVNLYEQGINGILADEMGLGKTVQSISVMAYLAETHNIWGPFLVIAPASTLHNWQQEIARFVPDLKVLPYWGNAKDRKVLRKFWDRKHITYRKESPFHVLVTSYQLVVQDTQYFQKIRWQYMILDEAQAIKSSQSSRWKSLLGFHCRNRLLLTGTPIQNNMQELWALLHFIMPSLFDSHDEFSEWFSKDIESHAQSNTKLNEDQLKRLHMILKPFMLRRIKKHVQKELGDKIEQDVFCDMTYRQRAFYNNLRKKISIMDLIEKAAVGDDQDTATLMNLVMQFRKVCNHPDLFERADTSSPFSFTYFAETASFMREGPSINVSYSVRNLIELSMPRLVCSDGGRLDVPGYDNPQVGWRGRYLHHLMNVWTPEHILKSSRESGGFSWLRFADVSAGEVAATARKDILHRSVDLRRKSQLLGRLGVIYDGDDEIAYTPPHAMLEIVARRDRMPLAHATVEGRLSELFNISKAAFEGAGLDTVEPCGRPAVSAPPIELYCSSQRTVAERQDFLFNVSVRKALYGVSEAAENHLLRAKVDPSDFPVANMLPTPISSKRKYNHVAVPSMRRFVTDSGKLAKLDQLLKRLKEEGHRVLLYFQMTRMIDMMEEYLTYRNYKYCRLDGSTKLEDRRDTVADFQTRPDIFVFLLSTRAGGLGINLTSADTVIFYDSDWNPTIDSQAMDRAHRLGQTKQVTVYRMITRGTIEERIRKRALQKEEVQRVVISGGAGVDFNTRSRENRTKDIAMWLADDDQAAEIEKKEAEIAAAEASAPAGGKKQRKMPKKRADMSLDDMYHEGEGHFDDGSAKPSGTATPVSAMEPSGKAKRKGVSKKAKTLKQRLAIADGEVDGAVGGA